MAEKQKISDRKESLRNDISAISGRIRRVILDNKVPRDIVDGSLDDVIKFKDAAADVGKMYHVRHHPGQTLSENELLVIRGRLEVMYSNLVGTRKASAELEEDIAIQEAGAQIEQQEPEVVQETRNNVTPFRRRKM